MKKTKILALTPDRGFGGAERVFNTLNNALLQDYEVEECFFNFGPNIYFETACNEHELGVKGGGNVLRKLFAFLERVYRFRKLIKSTKADIVISHLEGADYISLLSGTKAKKICVMHGSKLNDRNISGFRGVLRKKILMPYLYKKADHLIVVSDALKLEIKSFIPIESLKVSRIYNSVDGERLQQEANEVIPHALQNIFMENKVLITSCRLFHEKNLYALIDIFSVCKTKNDELKLVIIGDGNEKKGLIDFAELEGLQTSLLKNGALTNEKADVFFMGYDVNPHKYVSKACLYLLTSYNEGFPLGPLEAMACRTAVVASDCPTGPLEILQGSRINSSDELESKAYAGALLPIPLLEDQDTIDLWASIIDELLHNEMLHEQMIQNAQERLLALSPSMIYSEWKVLIESLEKV